MENGKQAITDSDIRSWCEVIGAPEPVTASLRDELRSLRVQDASWRRQLRARHRARQQPRGDVELVVSTIRAFDLAVVPGLLQTAEYARHVLLTAAELQGVPQDSDEAVRERMERQRVLYDPDKRIEILVLESALRFPVCPRDVLAAQIDRIIALQGLPSVRLGLIPLDTRVPAVPAHGFRISDDLVLVETVTSELAITEPDEVAVYHRLMDTLWTAAVEGAEARVLLARLATHLTSP